MSHELSMVGGRAEMCYVGERPWHGLGTELQKPATAQEAIRAAHLEWTVEKRPVMVDGKSVDAYRAVVRTDTGTVLGVTGAQYQPVQNVEAFGFFDAVVGAGQAIYHTAGALHEGRRVWILAKLPEMLRVAQTDDLVEKFVLLHTGHDGGSALQMTFTPVRVVCQNTLTLALRSAGSIVKIRHTQSATLRVVEAQRALGLAVRFYDDLEGLIGRLASVPVKAQAVAEYYRTLVPDNPEAESNARTENIRASMLRSFENGRGNRLPGVAGTWWAAYNGTTEYVDHDRSSRGTDESTRRSNRLSSIWFGSGAELKARAWSLALQSAGVAAGDAAGAASATSAP